MRLFHTATSPFVRKVMIFAHEAGIADRLELVTLRPKPTEADPTLSRVNPLNKIPALELDDGTTLFDSHVICDHLDALHAGPPLLPARGVLRTRALRLEALADGLLDAAILVFYERNNRPAELHWKPWLDGQTQKCLQALDALEAEADGFEDRVDLGTIAAAAALGWLEFRQVLGDVRPGRPRLFAWYDRFAQRPSMQATLPKA